MRDRFLIVHNPNAGAGRRDLLHRVVEALKSSGCRVALTEAVCSRTGTDAARAASKSGDYDAVVAAGGDGTLRSVASGLRGTHVPAGIIPLGTGNVMAHEIGLRREAAAVADYLQTGCALPIRGGTASETPFFLMAGIGLDAAAVAGLDLRLKRRIGKLAYVWPAVRAIFAPAPAITARLDGAPYAARWVVLCKSARYAGGFHLSPASHVTEPGLTAMVNNARTRAGLIVDILMIGAGLADRAPHIRFIRFRRAQLSADRSVPVQIDGESAGTLPLSVEEDSIPALLLVPAQSAAAARVGERAAA